MNHFEHHRFGQLNHYKGERHLEAKDHLNWEWNGRRSNFRGNHQKRSK